MTKTSSVLNELETRELRASKELQNHLKILDTLASPALGVLAVASGIYTYLGVSTLLEDNGAITFFAAIAYSIAVSVGIFVFWSYVLRLLPAMRSASGRLGLTFATLIGSLAIIAMSSWLNAAALAGSAAVEQHLERTVQEYQIALRRAHDIAISGQSLGREVQRARENFEALAEQESSGNLSGTAGKGAVFRVLTQKKDELASLEKQILSQDEPIQEAFTKGNEVLGKMRALTVAPGPVEERSLIFSEESVRLAAIISRLNQFSAAPLVARSAEDLPASIVLPQLDGRNSDVRQAQSATIKSVLEALDQRSKTLLAAANEVLEMEPPEETAYNPITSADAVIRYAENFIPSWAGAIAIDLLPGILVFILAVTQAAIRQNQDGLAMEDLLTLAELKASVNALRDVDLSIRNNDGK
tara:strand:+ start:347 stop:1591 length:1245 start_codon:yes stop_codon:yes gene_type:complete